MSKNYDQMKKKLVVIDACVRQEMSRTWRIAEPVIDALIAMRPSYIIFR
jgi:hypothetical protein